MFPSLVSPMPQQTRQDPTRAGMMSPEHWSDWCKKEQIDIRMCYDQCKGQEDICLTEEDVGQGSDTLEPTSAGSAMPICGQESPSLTTLAPVPSPLNHSLGTLRQNSEFGQCFPSVLHTWDPCLSSGKW